MRSVVKGVSWVLVTVGVTLTSLRPVGACKPNCGSHPKHLCVNILRTERTNAWCEDGSHAEMDHMSLREEDNEGDLDGDDVVQYAVSHGYHEGANWFITMADNRCYRGQDPLFYADLEWYIRFEAWCGDKHCIYDYCLPQDCQKEGDKMSCSMPRDIEFKKDRCTVKARPTRPPPTLPPKKVSSYQQPYGCQGHDENRELWIMAGRLQARCEDGSIPQIARIALMEEDANPNPDDEIAPNLPFSQKRNSPWFHMSRPTVYAWGQTMLKYYYSIDPNFAPNLEWYLHFEAWCGENFCQVDRCLPAPSKGDICKHDNAVDFVGVSCYMEKLSPIVFTNAYCGYRERTQ